VWICQNNDLARIRRVSKNFLVSGQRGIENDLAYALHRRAEGSAAKDAPVFERKNCLHGISPWEWTLSILTGLTHPPPALQQRRPNSKKARLSPGFLATSIGPNFSWPELA
jgi:hypothetical protein